MLNPHQGTGLPPTFPSIQPESTFLSGPTSNLSHPNQVCCFVHLLQIQPQVSK